VFKLKNIIRIEKMWIAYYKDGIELHEDSKEGGVRFDEIDQNQLSRFEVYDKTHKICVDLNTGVFNVDGADLIFDGQFSDFRLIYFKRVRQTLTLSNTVVKKEIILFVGWQTSCDGINIKRYVGFDGNKLFVHCK